MSMNPRYQPGGDKYDHRDFYDRVPDGAENIIEVLKSVVSTWTENEIEAGNEPMYERFRDEYPEWAYDTLIATISEEMERVRGICEAERRKNISKAVQAG